MPPTRPSLFPGVYERLLDEELNEAIQFHPDLPAILRKIDDESSPHAYAQFVGQILQQVLRSPAVEERRPLINRLLELLAARDGLDYLLRRRLLEQEPCVLTEVHPARETGQGRKSLPRPETPLNCSALLTGPRGDFSGFGLDAHRATFQRRSVTRIRFIRSSISGLKMAYG